MAIFLNIVKFRMIAKLSFLCAFLKLFAKIFRNIHVYMNAEYFVHSYRYLINHISLSNTISV